MGIEFEVTYADTGSNTFLVSIFLMLYL